MANKKIDIQKSEGPKVVKTYRIDPTVFAEAEAKCKQVYSLTIASFIEHLLKSHFDLKKKANG
jgi:hypothetical protein